jgi:hypothetical protein
MRISGLSREEATRRLLESLEHDIENDAARLVERRINEAKDMA